MGTALRKAVAKAKKYDALNASKDTSGARKEKLRIASNAQWSNRNQLPGAFHKPDNLTVGAISKHANRRHLVSSF